MANRRRDSSDGWGEAPVALWEQEGAQEVPGAAGWGVQGAGALNSPAFLVVTRPQTGALSFGVFIGV